MSPRHSTHHRVYKYAKTLHCECGKSYTRADYFERHKHACQHCSAYIAASEIEPDTCLYPFYCSCGVGYTAAHAFNRHCRTSGHSGDWSRCKYQPKGYQETPTSLEDLSIAKTVDAVEEADLQRATQPPTASLVGNSHVNRPNTTIERSSISKFDNNLASRTEENGPAQHTRMRRKDSFLSDQTPKYRTHLPPYSPKAEEMQSVSEEIDLIASQITDHTDNSLESTSQHEASPISGSSSSQYHGQDHVFQHDPQFDMEMVESGAVALNGRTSVSPTQGEPSSKDAADHAEDTAIDEDTLGDDAMRQLLNENEQSIKRVRQNFAGNLQPGVDHLNGSIRVSSARDESPSYLSPATANPSNPGHEVPLGQKEHSLSKRSHQRTTCSPRKRDQREPAQNWLPNKRRQSAQRSNYAGIGKMRGPINRAAKLLSKHKTKISVLFAVAIGAYCVQNYSALPLSGQSSTPAWNLNHEASASLIESDPTVLSKPGIVFGEPASHNPHTSIHHDRPIAVQLPTTTSSSIQPPTCNNPHHPFWDDTFLDRDVTHTCSSTVQSMRTNTSSSSQTSINPVETLVSNSEHFEVDHSFTGYLHRIPSIQFSPINWVGERVDVRQYTLDNLMEQRKSSGYWREFLERELEDLEGRACGPGRPCERLC